MYKLKNYKNTITKYILLPEFKNLSQHWMAERRSDSKFLLEEN